MLDLKKSNFENTVLVGVTNSSQDEFKLNEYLELNLTGQNIFDFKHKQILGGAVMGRQIIMRLSASL